ncbi:cysteine synthase family protein [bacterium]|nr:cysteine synthase family protein [bacterium]
MENILSLIGHTPLVKIKKLNPNPRVNIFAKLEGFNPTGSIKDRVALAMIEKAERLGKLTKNKTIIEATSGNTGISLTMIGRIKGYKVKVVIPENIQETKKKMLKIFGAKIISIKKEDWRNNAIKFTKELVKKNKNLVFLNQYENESNVGIHYQTTAKEILDQCNKNRSYCIDFFIAGIGTGGTITGIGRRLKEKFPNIKIIGVQPKLGENIEGLRSLKEGYIPPILNFKIIDEMIEVKEKDALQTMRELAKNEGIFAGASSGAVMFVVQKLAKKIKTGNTVVVFPDRGERYL